MKTNQAYKDLALSSLKGNWTPSVIATLVYFAIVSVCEVPVFASPDSLAWIFSGSLLAILIALPLSVGLYCAFRDLLTTGNNQVTNNMFHIGFGDYLHNLGGMFFMQLKTALWTFLLIIPGIIMGFAYALTPYILHDYPGMSAWEASAESRRMMKGHKMDLFLLYLSFIGWGLLCIVTLGIGLLWLYPYMYTTVGAFYEDVKVASGKADLQ